MTDLAGEAKAKGNAAFSQGNFSEAVTHFTEAIGHDPQNHVLYSNRAAAYASQKMFEESLKDAEKVIELKSDWPKGYSRKAAALHGMQDLLGAKAAFEKGLELDPSNAQLQQGLNSLQEEVQDQSAEIFSESAKLFTPDVWAKITGNPQLSKFVSQTDYCQKINDIIANPQNLSS